MDLFFVFIDIYLKNVKMAQFIITESQLEVLKSNLTSEVGKSEKQLDEAWYNTVMDIVGLADPTGVVDIVNGISYFTQGDTFFLFLLIFI